MMDIRRYIKDLDIADGETKRMTCPACGRANTFTVHNDMGSVVYNCYSLSCKTKGAVHVNLTAAQIVKRLTHIHNSKKSEPDTWTIPEYVVQPSADNELLNNFRAKWKIGNIRLLYDVRHKRAVFPIYYKGRIIDAVGRALDGAVPKWLRYSGEADVYKIGSSHTAVLVEDVISAYTVNAVSGATGVAILGTSLGPNHMRHLTEYSQIIVALDPDAAKKTIDYKRQIEAWTGKEVQALRLTDDIKYLREEDVDNLDQMVTKG